MNRNTKVTIDAETLATLTLAALHHGSGLLLQIDDDMRRKNPDMADLLMKRHAYFSEAYDIGEAARMAAIDEAHKAEAFGASLAAGIGANVGGAS